MHFQGTGKIDTVRFCLHTLAHASRILIIFGSFIFSSPETKQCKTKCKRFRTRKGGKQRRICVRVCKKDASEERSPPAAGAASTPPPKGASAASCNNIAGLVISSNIESLIGPSGASVTFIFADAPESESDVVVRTYARGDLGTERELYSVRDDGDVFLGVNAGPPSGVDCDPQYGVSEHVIPKSVYNGYRTNGNGADFQVVLNRSGPFDSPCGDAYVELVVEVCV